MNIHQAIYSLHADVVRIEEGDVVQAFDRNGNLVNYDAVAVQALVNSKAYITKRQAEYPSIGDQLDALFHAGVFPEAMAAEIQAIKDKYPKS